MIMTTMMAMIPGSRYKSAAFDAGVVGFVVAAAGISKFMWVCDDEAKYELDPPNDAVIAYVPGTGGVYVKSNCPVASVVVVPITT
jgi:uncharacterized membrane protein YhhN